MKKLLILIIGFATSLLILGCGRAVSVQTIDNSQSFEKSISMSKIEKAIRSGAARKGWRIKKIKTGLLEGQINVRGKHFVAVSIPYDKNGYRINYKSSRNLSYDASAGTIHPSYNKWITTLDRNIQYQLHGGFDTQSTQTVNKPAKKVTSRSKQGNAIDLTGKTIYIKAEQIPYSRNVNIAENIKIECNLNTQLHNFIIKNVANSGVKLVVKNDIKPTDLELKVQIDSAVSRGNAFIGHLKYVSISGAVVKGDTKYYSFKAARRSGGGAFGGFKSSCAVLGRTVETLGSDVSGWLSFPMDEARLGNTELIPY